MPVPDAAAFPVQPGLDPGLPAALGVAGMADWVALDYHGHLGPGEAVLILGAGGTAGQLAVQAARLLGAGRAVPVAAVRHECEVNVFAGLAVINAFLPALRRAPGRIVQIGAATGRLPPVLGVWATPA